VTIMRAAHPSEAALLSDLVLRAKAHWGYDGEFLDACRDELTVHPDRIERDSVTVVERDGVVCGVAALVVDGDDEDGGASNHAELDLFYIDPEFIGRGFGRRLWNHMVALAHRRGCQRLFIHSDPHAEGFYRSMGASRIGDVPSGSIEGRSLPLMCIDL